MFATVFFCYLCVIAHAHMCRDSHQVLQANVMNSASDSVNVIRLSSGNPQPSGGANIIRCLCCFTLLMNLHDFATEPFNPVHIFRDAQTVPFCLTADHVSTCLMSLSARFKPAQFRHVVNG